MQRIAPWVASLGPVGLFPVAPATFASLLLAAAYLLLPPQPIGTQLAWCVAVTVVGIWSAGLAERVWGEDPGRVVIDEAAGMAVTLLAQPFGWRTAALGFFFFRVFDIAKPPPARRAERLGGGLGVVADDLIAGVFAHLAVRLANALWP